MEQRDVAIKTAFSNKAQSAYGTKLPDIDIDQAHPLLGSENIESTFDKINDADQFGKGHEYPTKQENLTADVRVSRSADASSALLGWVMAFACGAITTTQPDDIGSPNTYEHEIKPMDIDDSAIGKQLPVTSIVEELASFKKMLYRDMLVSEFSITGEIKKQLQLSFSMIGSGHKETSTLTMPALTAVSFLKMPGVTITVGGTSYSAKLLNFNFSHKNELAEDLGYHPGSGYLTPLDPSTPQIRGKLKVSKRTTSLSFEILAEDGNLRSDMEANTEKAIVISAEGATIENSYKHNLELSFPKTFIKATPIGREGNFLKYQVETEIAWDSTSEAPFVATVRNNVASYLT